jgi:anaerobic dimethyl sulfoxide reductase subunit C (anchor subunit)
MKERSLVVFTLLAQAAVGALWTLGAIRYLTAGLDTMPGFLAVAALMVLAMAAALLHLGSPLLAWRALRNVRSSWLSREIWCTVLFGAASTLYAGLLWFDRGSPLVRGLVWGAAALLGLMLLLSMSWAYRLRTVPAWNQWSTPVSFLVTALLLGGMTVSVLAEICAEAAAEWTAVGVAALHSLRQWTAVGTIALLCVEFLYLPLWLVGLAGRGRAGALALRRVVQEQGALFRWRLVLMIAAVVLAGRWLMPLAAWWPVLRPATGLVVLASEVFGRVLFYAAYAREGM